MKALSKKKPTKPGVLLVVICLFMGSAVVRAIIGADEAIAQATEPKVDLKGAINSRAPENETPSDERARLANLLAILQEKQESLDAKESEQNDRELALNTAESEMADRLRELQKSEEELRRTTVLANGAAETDLSRLTSVYENMKPKDAATLFEAMEPDFAAGFLGRMRADAAAKIMAGLSPEFAYMISVIVAGRNANAPKN